MALYKYVIPASVSCTLVGGVVLLKDYLAGPRYKGEERIPGKTVIITGANSGIGKEVARDLAKRGGKIILACRNMEECKQVQGEIKIESYNRNVICKKLDLGSTKSIRVFAADINKNESRVDVLINNAGIMRTPTRVVTEDGFEAQLGINHLGHFLLTTLLLDKLKKSAPSRIINVSSIAHKRGKINFDDLNSKDSYEPGEAYDQSKLANILFTIELAERLKGTGVTVNAVHPGLVKTKIFRYMGLYNSNISSFILFPLTWLVLRTPEQGAQTTLYCALAPELVNVTGKYFCDCKEAQIADQGLDKAAAKRLWAISDRWTRFRLQ